MPDKPVSYPRPKARGQQGRLESAIQTRRKHPSRARIPTNYRDILIERIELAVAAADPLLTLEQWGRLYARLFPEDFEPDFQSDFSID